MAIEQREQNNNFIDVESLIFTVQWQAGYNEYNRGEFTIHCLDLQFDNDDNLRYLHDAEIEPSLSGRRENVPVSGSQINDVFINNIYGSVLSFNKIW